MRKAVALIPLVFVGCLYTESISDINIQRQYRCQPKQFETVKIEASYCVESKAYSSSHCFDSAIVRNCDRLENVEKK
jgi:hypothetical protein